MAAGGDGGVDDFLVGGVVAEAGDVLADGAGEELVALRHVADRGTDLVGMPVAEIGAVDADGAGGGDGGADDQAAERALARARGTDKPGDGAGIEIDRDAVDDRRGEVRMS